MGKRAVKRHLRLMQLEKQRLEFMLSIQNQFQLEFAKFSITEPKRSRKKLLFGIIAIGGAMIFGYWDLLKDIISVFTA